MACIKWTEQISTEPFTQMKNTYLLSISWNVLQNWTYIDTDLHQEIQEKGKKRTNNKSPKKLLHLIRSPWTKAGLHQQKKKTTESIRSDRNWTTLCSVTTGARRNRRLSRIQWKWRHKTSQLREHNKSSAKGKFIALCPFIKWSDFIKAAKHQIWNIETGSREDGMKIKHRNIANNTENKTKSCLVKPTDMWFDTHHKTRWKSQVRVNAGRMWSTGKSTPSLAGGNNNFGYQLGCFSENWE